MKAFHTKQKNTEKIKELIPCWQEVLNGLAAEEYTFTNIAQSIHNYMLVVACCIGLVVSLKRRG